MAFASAKSLARMTIKPPAGVPSAFDHGTGREHDARLLEPDLMLEMLGEQAVELFARRVGRGVNDVELFP